jgi:anti-sigma factor RsiW
MADKMNNQDVEFLISQYMDDQLDSAQKLELERRVAQAPAVAEAFRQYRALEGHLTNLELPSLDLDGVDFDSQRSSIMANLERKALLTQRRRRLTIPAIFLRPAFVGALAAAAMVVLAVGVGIRFINLGSVNNQSAPAMASVVTARMLPPALGSPGGKAVVQAYSLRMDEDEIDSDVLAGLPAGTVMVSVPPQGSSQDRQAAMPFMQF